MEEITNSKPKDPKRVEAGKKLAAISKAAKEKKRIRTAKVDEEWDINYGYVIGIAGIIIAVVGIYYKSEPRVVVVRSVEKEKKECVKEPLDSFD